MNRPSIVTLARRLSVAMLIASSVTLTVACSKPPTVKTAQERVQIYKDCWDSFNARAWDKFGQCYTKDAVSEDVDSTPPSVTGRAAILKRDKQLAVAFPDRKGEVQLILQNRAHAASIAIYTGTQTGPMPPGPDGKAMPATNRKIGFYIAHTIEFDPTGTQAVRDAGYVDEGTLMAQLGVRTNPAREVIAGTGAAAIVVIGQNDLKERDNIGVAQSLLSASHRHDLKRIEALLADDYKRIEIGQPSDLDKKKAMAATRDLFAAFPDIATTPGPIWTAGDYVVIEGSIAGTNKGPMPSMGIATATNKPLQVRFLEVLKIDSGKIKEDWLFYNSSAFATQMGLK